MNRRPLQHALETRGRLRIVAMRSDEVGEFVVDVIQDLSAQAIEIDPARAQYGDGILVLGERQQQMFQRCIFVPALIGVAKRPVQRLLEIA